MKMSEVFEGLPMPMPKEHLIFKTTTVDFNHQELTAVCKSVNNHDALVEALSELLEFNKTMGRSFFGTKDYCPYCDQVNTHGKDCAHKKAINLLDKINGESNEN